MAGINIDDPKFKLFRGAVDEMQRKAEFSVLPQEEKIKIIKQKYNLTHGKGKRKKKK